MIESLLIYITIALSSVCLVVHDYRKYQMHNAEICLQNTRRKISYITIVVIVILFSLYNMYVTIHSPNYGGDRINYVAYYNGVKSLEESALVYVINFFNNMGLDYKVLFYFTTFFLVSCLLIAYKISVDALPSAFMFIVVSQYILISFTALKQTYAIAFATLFFALVLTYGNARISIWEIVMIVLAILFHPSAFLLILIYIMIKMRKNTQRLAILFLCLIVITIFMEPIMIKAASFLNPIIPGLAAKISSYFGSARTVIRESSSFAILKGTSLFFIAIYGSLKRKYLVNKIRNYDNYLILSWIAAFCYIMGVYNQWLSRAVYLFIFPVYIFWGLLLRYVRIPTNKFFYYCITFAFTALVTYREIALVYINWGGAW